MFFGKNARVKQASSFIHLDTYRKADDLIVSHAIGERPYIGRAYMMSPLIGGGGDFSNVIQNVLKSASDDANIQVIEICVPNHDAHKNYLSGKTFGNETIQELIHRQSTLFSGATQTGWSTDVPLLNKRFLIVTLAMPVRSINAESLEQAHHDQSEFLVGLRGCGFVDVHALSAGELLGIYRLYAHIYEPHQPVHLDENLEIRFQAFGPDEDFDFRDRRIGKIAGETYVSVVTTKAYPEEPFHGIMNLATGAPFNRGQVKEGGGQRILTPFIFVTNIRVANQRREIERIEQAIESRTGHKPLPIKLGSENAAAKLESLNILKSQCDDGKNKIVYVSITAILYGKTADEAIQAAAVVKNTLNMLEFDAREVYGNALVRWAQCLPLNFSTKVANSLDNEGIMSAQSAGTLLPVFGDSTGNVHPTAARTGSCYITRRGSPFYFDMFTSQSNYSGVISAGPGSGKSFAVQHLIMNELALGTAVVHIDNGKSARKFCIASGGEYNDFTDLNSVPSFNPFTGLNDVEFDQQQESITALLLMMSYDQTETMDVGARIAMTEAVKAAYGKHQGETEIRHVIESLTTTLENATQQSADHNQVVIAAINLIPRLRAFMDSPSRGKLFRGKGTMDLHQQYTVFELSGLGGDDHLRRVVYFFLLNMTVTRAYGRPGRMLVVADEALEMLQDERAALVFEGLNLKGRKEKVSLWLVVQSMWRMIQSPSGNVILKMSPWKMILAQEQEEYDQLIKEGILTTFTGDPFFVKLLKSIETKKGVYSEIMMLTPTNYEVVRLYVDPFTQTLFSSEGADRDEVFRLMDAGMKPVEAVYHVMADKKEARLQFTRDYIEHLRNFYNVSNKELLSDLHEALK